MGHQVFVSHSSEDKIAADAIVAHLERNGISCWVAPRDILPGSSWASSILKAISGAQLMLLVFSDHANSSQHVRNEVERAVHHGIPVAPVRITDVMPSEDLELFLSSSHWMDAMTPPLERHLELLAEKLKLLMDLPGGGGVEARVQGKPEPVTAAARGRGRSRLLVGAGVGVVICLLIASGIFYALGKLSRQAGVSETATETVNTHQQPSKIGQVYRNSIGMTLTYIPAGEFVMGSPNNEVDRSEDEVQHKVKLTRSFLMATTPITQGQWKALMGGSNSSHFQGDDLPVETITWQEAEEFCERLSRKEGKHYRLPTEAEWEYACRAGTTTAYCLGEGEQALEQVGWYMKNSSEQTHPVGLKKANPWGLFDMQGNVCQWCSDWCGHFPEGDAIDPQGATVGTGRIMRGGAWTDIPAGCRAAHRFFDDPVERSNTVGFRAVMELQ